MGDGGGVPEDKRPRHDGEDDADGCSGGAKCSSTIWSGRSLAKRAGPNIWRPVAVHTCARVRTHKRSADSVSLLVAACCDTQVVNH